MKHTISSVFMLSFAMLLFSGCKKKDKDQPQQSTTAPVLIPMVVTAAITGITDSTAVSGGTVTSEGASAITAVGICWDTMPSPTTLKQKTVNGAGVGDYIAHLSGLKINRKYYVRAYATNANGTAYGNEISFLSPVVAPWQKTSLSFDITCMIGDGATIFAGTGNGIVFSSDTGNTWTNKGLSGMNIRSIVQTNNSIYAVTNANNLYLSADNGGTWTLLNGSFPYTVKIYDVAVSNGRLFAGTDSSAFYSTNNGSSWTRCENGLNKPVASWGGGVVTRLVSDQQGVYAVCTRFAPTTMPAYISDLFKYNDVSNQWINVSSFSYSYVESYKTLGNTHIVSDDYSSPQGIFYSTIISYNNGANWTSINTVYSSVEVYKQNILLSNPQGLTSISSDGGHTWKDIKLLGLPQNGLNNAFISEKYLWRNTTDGLYKYRYN